MRLELSRRAETDLADIRDYSVEQFGLARTINYLDAIEQAFRRLLSFPEIGELQSELAPNTDTTLPATPDFLYDRRRLYRRSAHPAQRHGPVAAFIARFIARR